MTSELERVAALLDELVRLNALLVRSQYETQKEAILAFSEAGLKARRISELLNTTVGTVNVTISRSR